jgi:hypothetical protein
VKLAGKVKIDFGFLGNVYPKYGVTVQPKAMQKPL